MDTKLVDNVWAFLDKASTLYGRFKAQSFSQEMHANCVERGMSSPIEHLFWIACHALGASRFTKVNPGPEYDQNGELTLGYGIFINPQVQIGTYRVDFVVNVKDYGSTKYQPVVVELDGHDFHDKDKRQRSYEKARDRFLVKEGYRVLHFTGSDVVADPFKVAHEVLNMVGLDGDGVEYNPADPMDMGV